MLFDQIQKRSWLTINFQCSLQMSLEFSCLFQMHGDSVWFPWVLGDRSPRSLGTSSPVLQVVVTMLDCRPEEPQSTPGIAFGTLLGTL